MKLKLAFFLAGLLLLALVVGYFPKSQGQAEEFTRKEASQLPTDLPPATVEVIPTVTAPPSQTPLTSSQTTVPMETQIAPSLTDSLKTRSLIATRAAELAVDSMPGAYSWEELRTCSTFVAAYLRQLSFPVNGLQGQYAAYEGAFPWTSVMDQTAWLRLNYPQYTHDAPLIDFLNGRLWDRIQPGDVIFLQSALNHNGYNTYYHTVVLVGYENGEPIFAELAAGMNNASAHRTFRQMTRNYQDNLGSWNVSTSPEAASSGLIVTWFDPLAIINRGKLWQQQGQVMPNSDKVMDYFDSLVMVNIYDGTTIILEKQGDPNSLYSKVSLGGRNSFFAVTGRLLPANKKITEVFMNERSDGIYDGDFGVYYSKYGVYQHSWTPQMVARIDGIEVISGFGGLNGNTETSLPMPLSYDKKGNLIDYVNRSSFTIHKIPDVTNQDILLRLDLLTPANDPTNPEYGALPYPTGALSSGCVNYDPDTWKLFREYIKGKMAEGKKVGLVMSYPGFDQNLLPTLDLNHAPFTGSQFNKWCYNNSDCDPLDRRNYRGTYLDLP